MSIDRLRKVPTSTLLLVVGAACVILGATEKLAIGKDKSIQMAHEYKLAVVITGGILVIAALLELRRPPKPVAVVLPVTRVKVTAADKLTGDTAKPELRARIKGRVEPPIQGLRVWLLREDFARNPGHFSVESKAAVTDKEGEWEQIVHLWGAAGGKFRVHAVIGSPLAEQFFTYYRTAFEHARSIYREKVDVTAQGFPGWPGLNSFPSDCLSDFREVST